MLDLGIFGLEFENNVFIFEIRALQFVQNEFFTQTLNFFIGLSFSKVLASAFSEDLDPGRIHFIRYVLSFQGDIVAF